MMLLLMILACGNSSDVCDSGMDVTYADFGETFIRQHCQGCHASSSNNRHGAPESVHFDTIEDIWSRRDDILRVTTSEEADMPPAWELDQDNVYLLEQWLECGSKRADRRSMRHFNP